MYPFGYFEGMVAFFYENMVVLLHSDIAAFFIPFRCADILVQSVAER